MKSILFRTFILISPLLLWSHHATARVTYPSRPSFNSFVNDGARLLKFEDERQLETRIERFLSAEQVPIIIITISSMSRYGAGDLSIDTYARMMYDEYGIGHRKKRRRRGDRETYNRGILVLVSVDDRKARIELGAGFGRDYDTSCDQIMRRKMIPHFKNGNHNLGIISGVNALMKMVRTGVAPTYDENDEPFFDKEMIKLILIIALIILLNWLFPDRGRGRRRRGYYDSDYGSGWSSGGSSSGSSGGSYGGGYSGGGGSTGSW